MLLFRWFPFVVFQSCACFKPADGTDEMLVCAHAAGYAVHDYADVVGFWGRHFG